MNQEKFIASAKEAVKLANSHIRAAFGGEFAVSNKSQAGEIVTAIDLQVDALVCSYLRKETGISTLSEEDGLVQPEVLEHSKADYQWIVDPIDGTTNFSRSIELFAVSVALRHKDEILLGVIGTPVNEAVYWASKNSGAFKNGSPISVANQEPRVPVLVLNNGYSQISHERCKTQTIRISNRFCKRSFGTTVLELCWLAEGKVDAFVCSGDKIWDFAAGILLAKEAGAVVTDWKGREFRLDRDDLICCISSLHQELVESSRDLVD